MLAFFTTMLLAVVAAQWEAAYTGPCPKIPQAPEEPVPRVIPQGDQRSPERRARDAAPIQAWIAYEMGLV